MPGKLKITGSNLTPRDPIDVKSYCAGRQAAKDGKPSPTFGTVKTGLIANNNAITWTAKLAGQGITISLIDPAADDQPLIVTTNGLNVIVSLATGADGSITSTATEVMTAVANNDGANRLLGGANDGASTGAGPVVAAAARRLTGSNMPQSADNSAINSYVAGVASWTADPTGVGRDACALPYGGGHA